MSGAYHILQQVGGYLWQSLPSWRPTGGRGCFPFFELPPEIRMQIYEEYFRIEPVNIIYSDDTGSALLQASSRIRREAEELYFPHTKFYAVIDADATGLFKWLRNIGTENARVIEHLALACDLTAHGKKNFAMFRRGLNGRRPTLDALGIQEDWVMFFETLLGRGVRANAITTFRLDVERMSTDRLDQFRLQQHQIFEERLEGSLALAEAKMRSRHAD